MNAPHIVTALSDLRQKERGASSVSSLSLTACGLNSDRLRRAQSSLGHCDAKWRKEGNHWRPGFLSSSLLSSPCAPQIIEGQTGRQGSPASQLARRSVILAPLGEGERSVLMRRRRRENEESEGRLVRFGERESASVLSFPLSFSPFTRFYLLLEQKNFLGHSLLYSKMACQVS